MENEELRKLLIERIQDNMNNIFFDNIAKDISNNDFESSFSILLEIKERICNLVPNRSDIHSELNENIDVDFYRQIHSNNALNIDIINGIINYVIDKIKQFDSIENEPWYEIWKTGIAVKIQNKEPLEKILPEFFKKCMTRIDKVESGILAFKQSDVYKFLCEKIGNRK